MKKVTKIGWHLFFWVALTTMVVFFDWMNQDFSSFPGLDKVEIESFFVVYAQNVEKIVLMLIISVPVFYFSYFFFSKKRLIRSKLLSYLLYALFLLFYGQAISYLFFKLFPLAFYFGTPVIFRLLLPLVFFSGLGGVFYAYQDKLQKDILGKTELEKQNYKLELDYLKSSISPHFLFNTINNIDILIPMDPEKASQYLKQLSEILRFIIYSINQNYILLKDEIEYIKKFVQLHQLRTTNLDFVKFLVKGDVDGWFIAPMIYIPFIENAFKFSSNKKIKDAVVIIFEISQTEVIFTCSNYISKQEEIREGGGTGIQTAEKRLKLLYNNNYILEKKIINNYYHLKLIICR